MLGKAFSYFVLFAFLASCSGAANPLPHAVYYLSGRDADAQVWRLEPDGVATTQLTYEVSGVVEFAVSPTDGSLAIITENQLYLLDQSGDRRLVADASAVDENIEDYIFRGFVSDPVFSPDGATLAYAFDGIHFYDLNDGQDRNVITNLGNLLGEPFVFAKEVYSPGAWSADGGKLLITMGYYEGSTLAVMDPDAEQPFTRLRSDGPVCCQFSWSADSRSVLAANPYYTGDTPGLWRFDATTGEQEVLVRGVSEDGISHYVGWPFQFVDGSLFYFHAGIEHFSPDDGIPLKLVKGSAYSSGAELRPENFSIREALWAPDGSLALVLEPGETLDRLLLVPSDDGAIQILLEAESIRSLAWGQ